MMNRRMVWLPALLLALVAAWWFTRSTKPAPEPAPAPVPAAEKAPEVVFRLPTQDSKSPAPIPRSAELAAARAVLHKVVVDHARDPKNPWAVVHGMLALGPDMELTDGRRAIDGLFADFAEVVEVGGVPLVGFPDLK